MQLLLKFDIKANKEDISADFWNAHNGNWKNNEKPTDTEFRNSIKDEISTWLDDIELGFDMKDLSEAGVTVMEHEKAEAFNELVEGMKALEWDKYLNDEEKFPKDNGPV